MAAVEHAASAGPEGAARIYATLRRIRRFEEEVARIYPSDKIKSPVHLSIGQEAIAVGVIDALEDRDVVSATYRGHAAFIAKGGDLPGMMAELYGKAGGCVGGKGGSMHLAQADRGILGTSAVVGTTVPVAVGFAMALKQQKSDAVVVVFFGDGATEEGVFYESINFAALHRLPVIFVCENNGYAIHTPISKRWSAPSLADRIKSFGLPTTTIPDMDVFAIRKAVSEAATAMRGGDAGPVFVECHCCRWREHVGPNEDFAAGYRSEDEAAYWRDNDQVVKVGALLPEDERARVDAAVEAEIAAAIEFAETSPFPDAEELLTHVYA